MEINLDFYHQNKCKICKSNKFIFFDNRSLFFSSKSPIPEFHKYKNFICSNCGVVTLFPKMTSKKIVKYYNSIYRSDNFSIKIKNSKLKMPIQFPKSIYSFLRFRNFLDVISNTEFSLNRKNYVLDYGGYQGSFLYAMSKVWKSNYRIYDFNKDGIDFAIKFFNFKYSRVIDDKDMYLESEKNKYKLITLVHSFEHIYNPVYLLKNIHKVLDVNGYIYIEVPNVFANPLNDPTHVFMYDIDLLKKILINAGFEIINIKYNSYPYELNYGSKEQNISVLAQKLMDIHNCKQDLTCNVKNKILKIIFYHNIIGITSTTKRIYSLFLELCSTLFYLVKIPIFFLFSFLKKIK